MKLTTIICLIAVPLMLLQICIAQSSKKVPLQTLGIKWTIRNNVDSNFVKLIDEEMQNIFTNFNSENRSYTIHKATENDTDVWTIDFPSGKFATKKNIIATTVLSAVGLLATPPVSYFALNKRGAFAFWIFSQDKLYVTTSNTETLSKRKIIKEKYFKLRSLATFSTTKNRLKRMQYSLKKIVYQNLVKADFKNKRNQ